MRQQTMGLKIFHKLLLSLLVVALMPLVSLWYIGSVQVSKDAKQSIAKNLVMTASTIAAGINAWDDANVRVLRQAAKLDDMLSMDPALQTPILQAMGETYEWAFVVFTIDPTGANIARSDDSSLKTFGERSYFQQAMKGEAASRQVLVSKSTGKPALTLAVPLREPLSIGAHGVLAMAMKLDDISKVIKDTRIGTTGYALLLDAEKKLIAHGMPDERKEAVQDMSAYPAFQVDGISVDPTVYEVDGKKVVGYVRKLPQGWTLLVEQDYGEAYAALERLETGARILIGLTATLVVAVAFFLGKQLTRPIKQLIFVAEQLSKGQFQETIPGTERADEIGALARAVERLGVSIRLAMERLRKRA